MELRCDTSVCLLEAFYSRVCLLVAALHHARNMRGGMSCAAVGYGSATHISCFINSSAEGTGPQQEHVRSCVLTRMRLS